MSSVPHYWFRIPLEGTADHLKKAKAEGGKDAVKREIGKDAQMKRKTLENTEFANDESYCDAEIDSRAPLTREECDWFRERWDITRHGHAPCRPDVRPSD